MTRKEQIKSAYKLTGGHASFYDGMMTYSTLPGKAICRIVWNMDGDLYQPKGFFTPPYETEQSLRRRLSGLYKEAEVTMVEGMGCFCCRK